MAGIFFWVWIVIFSLLYIPISGIILVVPEDVPAGFATIFGFSPRLVTGNDHRLGFGFSLGNQADFQVMYEFGPQTYTQPVKPIRVRSATVRRRLVRRRPILEFLLNLGLVKEISYRFDVVHDDDNEPR